MRLMTMLLLFFLCFFVKLSAQDTFSIVAVDSITGEVGSAGASCVDLIQFGLPTDDFLGVLFPGKGAINSQAYYISQNQDNATARMNLGDTPAEIIEWLVANDVQNNPERRQYGIVALENGTPLAAAHTGTRTDDYKGHIVGSHYAIQGNILSGQAVLDSMEARFLREQGDLSCKLMAALQGAKVVGADSRCATNGSSSLFAFVKVAQPTDPFGAPSYVASVRTRDGDRIEPIDSLQVLVDSGLTCGISNTTAPIDDAAQLHIYPNPVQDHLYISGLAYLPAQLRIYNITGKLIHSTTLEEGKPLDVSFLESGLHVLEVAVGKEVYRRKILVE